MNTKTQMVTLGSQAATLADIQVPAGTSRISHIIGVMSGNAKATGVGTGFIRVEGDALTKGPETYAIGAQGSNSAVGIPSNNPPIFLNNVDIPVTPTNRVQLFGEMTPTDIGQITIGVTLVFE